MENNRGKLKAGFLIPSMLGIILFMIPVKYNNRWTICVKILADKIQGNLANFLPILCVLIVTVSAVMSLIALFKPKFIEEHALLKDIFAVTIPWIVIRVLGAFFIWLTYLRINADDDKTGILHMLTNGDTGGFILDELLTMLVIIFAIAGLLLPLLLDFGLLEFVGALLTPIMRPLFKIPGRAAVDCFTS